jgi:hypothetical protein
MPPFDFDASASSMPDDTGDKAPNLMPDVAIFDALRLYGLGAARRSELLTVRTFQIKYLDDIPPLSDALYQSQKAYLVAQNDKINSSSKLIRDESTELISSVMRAARYYYRDDREAQRQLDEIGETGAVHDRYGDLLRTADFCASHPQMLADEPRIPANVVERAREIANTLVTLPDTSASKATRRRRNLAFWMLTKAVSELRAAILHKFADDPDFLELAAARYEAPKKRKSKAAETTADLQSLVDDQKE